MCCHSYVIWLMHSRNSREQLRAHRGLDIYLSSLDDEYSSVIDLDSISACLAQDNDNSNKVEQALLKNEAIQKLVNFFQSYPERHFVHILEPLFQISSKFLLVSSFFFVWTLKRSTSTIQSQNS
ncbi:hypothetical protein Bca4012_085251 [Brassica carinata]